MYALIENGEITRYNISLPISIGSTSIPSGATGLEQFGLYPIVGDEPTPTGKQRVATYQYQFDGAQVNRVVVLEDIPDEEKASQVRTTRNNKLTASDWTQVEDAPVNKQAWATYRQALRDVTTQSGFPWEVTWPDAP
jgi:hypothetical protein